MRLTRAICITVLALGLSGCMHGAMLPGLGGDKPTDEADVTRASGSFTQPEAANSELIAALLARDTLLEAGSSYDDVASAALAASARASEADLRAARLRAEAKSKNWLPTLGPSVSLTSLGDLVSSILVEQVLFDNGRRKAERAFAAADVEVAAVTLSIDMNTRVESAVSLYVAAMRGEEKAAHYRRALTRMAEFERIVVGRVRGGISDRSDQRVVEAKINDMVSGATAAEEAAQTARAELKAMTGRDFDTTPAALHLGTPPGGTPHLSVLRAQAEGTRSVAQTRVERAGLLPSLSASGSVTGDGDTAGSLDIGMSQPLGFGTPAMLRAIEAARDSAGRRVAEADEDARRTRARQEQRMASYRRQEDEAAELARASRETFRLFQAQFKAGQRSVMDVIAVYEQLVEREQAHVDAKYEVVLIQLQMARDLGLLADGEEI